MNFDKQRPEGLIGVRTLNGTDIIAIKFRYRKNLPGGCIIHHPFLCANGAIDPHELCPVRTLWANIRTDVGPYQPIFTHLNGRNSNPAPQRVLFPIDAPESARFSIHCFRRGAAQELANRRSALRMMAGSGVWNSKAPRGYVDLTHAESATIADIRLDPSLSSDSDEDLPTDAPAIRNRILIFSPNRVVSRAKSFADLEESDPISDTSSDDRPIFP